MRNVLTFYNVHHKVIAMTIDNANTMKKTAQLLGISSVPCIAHILNSIVKKSLNPLGLKDDGKSGENCDQSLMIETDEDTSDVTALIQKCRK